MMKYLITIVLSVFSLFCNAQSTAATSQWPEGFWKARWITHPTAPGSQFGVFHFRKNIALATKPSSFIIHITADNRYRLFVNGRSVSTGPARSDLANWNFETVDLAPYLQAGENCIAATVWNFGEFRPYSQVSFQTALLIQGNDAATTLINTNKSWKVIQDSAYAPLPINRAQLRAYTVVAEGEQVSGEQYTWDFEKNNYNDAHWPAAQELWYAAKTRTYGTDGNWMLVPRSIPLLEESEQPDPVIRRISSAAGKTQNAIQSIRIPAHSKESILLDQGMLTNAYPTLEVSGGKNASIDLTYAEALMDAQRHKGHRDSIEGKKIIGIQDRFVTDGGQHRRYTPLHFRTYRYLQLDIETKAEPLVIEKLSGVFTAYPFTANAHFASDQKELDSIWKVGWRTARLCAMDTYVDCPYYEQLQYVGDTRIQALISLYVSGDDRLMKKAINDIAHSFFADGLTQSRYPSRDMQVIPTFSLWWICMLYDYAMHRGDLDFVKEHMNVVESILQWYYTKIGKNGMLGPLNWWQFVDWSWEWDQHAGIGGVPPGASSGGSSIITLQYAYTLQKASFLMQALNRNERAREYQSTSTRLLQSTYRLCWDSRKGLLADTYEKKTFSQHANILGILTNGIPNLSQKEVLGKILKDTSLTPVTYYFAFYLFEALKQLKEGDRFLDMLQPWYTMLNNGLTTFAEGPEPVRSDCHAWSASPNYEFLSLICGISPALPGLKKVNIEPYPGKLNFIEGKMPVPQGTISISMKKANNNWKAVIELPANVTGTFHWKGKVVPLKAGRQELTL